MKFAKCLVVASAIAGMFGTATLAHAASLAVGKKLELKVDPR